MYTPEQESRLSQLREKVLATGDLTMEEEKEILALIREGRVSASYASEAKKKATATAKAAKAPVDGGALLAMLKMGAKV